MCNTAHVNVKSWKLERVVDRVTQVVTVMSLDIFETCAYGNYVIYNTADVIYTHF